MGDGSERGWVWDRRGGHDVIRIRVHHAAWVGQAVGGALDLDEVGATFRCCKGREDMLCYMIFSKKKYFQSSLICM